MSPKDPNDRMKQNTFTSIKTYYNIIIYSIEKNHYVTLKKRIIIIQVSTLL